MALALVGALLTAALALAGARTGTYSGTTSENQAVTFKITSHGKVISNFSTVIGYDGKCGQGGGAPYNVKARRIAIGAGGKFSKQVTFRFAPAHISSPGRISGTAKGSSVHGKVVQYLKGKPNRCYTETFTATRAG